MTFYRCSAIMALAVFSNAAVSASYQGEGFGSYNDWDGDKAYELSATAYFEPVATDARPLREAAFLQRASNANLTFTRLGSEPDELNLANINVGYYVPDSMFYVGGHYTHIDELEDEFQPDYRDNDWGVTLGITPAEGLLLSTSYRAAPVYAGSLLGRLIGSGIFEQRDSYELNLSAKYVTDLADDRAMNIEGGIVRSDIYDLFFLGGDYYIDNTFSVGAWVEDFGSIVDETGYGIRAEKFFKENVSIQASYFDVSDTDIWQVAFRLRM